MRELLLAAAGAQGKLYVEDLFSAYTYTGNGSTQTITNGIDLTKGGMVWLKDRVNGSYDHQLVDSARGVGKVLVSDGLGGEFSSATVMSSFNSNGFSVGNNIASNWGGDTYASWTFRRAARFFDVVTWTGDGTSNRQIPHALGIAPGMVTAKRRDSTGDWAVWHRSATGDLYLDTAAAQTGSFTQITAASATTFSVSGNANINGATYVAYAWAHDPDTVNGIVQCGTFTTDGTAGNATVSLGWEPQFTMVKSVSNGSSSNWYMQDSARGSVASGAGNALLYANSASAEVTGQRGLDPNATGFTIDGAFAGFNISTTYVYLAIRRGPMRTPTSGASVYNAIARTGTGAAATVTGVGFAPDMVIAGTRNTALGRPFYDRLRGANKELESPGTATEYGATDALMSFGMGGMTLGADASLGNINTSGYSYINWFFARAPQFLDIVCYKGTGANQTLTHNLGVAPGMMWIKDRTTASSWAVYHSATGPTKYSLLNTNSAASTDSTFWNNTPPTSAAFTIGTGGTVNQSGDNYVAYLFASCPGVSSIGSYTGNGATQTINCGFAAGARFVIIKRTDATGSWLVLDTVRGIISGNDPYLQMDQANVEANTADLLTPQSVGFGLTSNALVNASGGSYIYFSVA